MKFEVSTNFICSDSRGVIITTNKVAVTSDLNAVEKYIKELNNIDSNDIISPWLSQFKLYLKILGLLYLEKTNLPITSNVIKK